MVPLDSLADYIDTREGIRDSKLKDEQRRAPSPSISTLENSYAPHQLPITEHLSLRPG
jgi:hypothetical protein